MELKDRRELKSRRSRWAQTMAQTLANLGVTPNAISLFSIVCAAVALALLLAYRLGHLNSMPAFLLAAFFIQIRLVCNLMDGLVAVEHGKKTATGDLYNEVPDRWADSFLILGAGYAGQLAGLSDWGWAATSFALLTAYTRALGRSLGSPSYYLGPMAKQHRMFVLTLAFIVCAFASLDDVDQILLGALVVITVGSALTSFRRLSRIAADLRAKGVS